MLSYENMRFSGIPPAETPEPIKMKFCSQCPMVDTGLGSFMYLSGSHIVTLLRFKEPIYA